MAIATFKKTTDKHIKQIKPKHYKYAKYLTLSIIINIISISYIILTTIK